jgi:hypothetical protein
MFRMTLKSSSHVPTTNILLGVDALTNLDASIYVVTMTIEFVVKLIVRHILYALRHAVVESSERF